jgi:hypothetical protein
MISAARLRACDSLEALLDLLRELGYPVQPIPIVPAEWRRAGIDISWSDDFTLVLACRDEQLDCYAIAGNMLPPRETVTAFLRSLASYNVLTKPVVIAWTPEQIALYDLSAHRELRRLDVDVRNPSPHALDRLNILGRGDVTDGARLFDRALDRETLTRQFFERFRDAVRDITIALREQFPREKHEALSSEALLILSRLLFLYFVQQKGWLNGERRFLVDRLERAVRTKADFFADVLRPLFFGCLNTPRPQRDACARRLGDVPYLNGGLFEPSPFEARHEDIRLPNALMQRVIETVFERFAFSIDENDFAGSHVDPEMLGKVFESLMAEEERAASGSFYTPKSIVDVLTERAILEWCGIDDLATLSKQSARQLLPRLERLTVLDPACGSGAFLLSALRVIEKMITAAAEIAEVEFHADLRQGIVERSLFGVDLKPEAVRLCELRLWLAIVARRGMAIDDIPPLPNLDRNILQGNSLLSPIDFLGDGRADVYRQWVCALRTQSDLIARYRTARQKERSALARMIRATDRKLATELLERAIDVDECELQRLSLPQKDLFGRSRQLHAGRCRELHARIRETRRALARAEEGELDFFSFDVHFAPVMTGGGFDVVIGNPPWVRNSRIDGRAKRMYADRYRLFRASSSRNAAFHQPDLSIVFFERAVSLAAPAGVLSLLMPAKVMNAAYAAPLRRAAESMSIVALDDWSDTARRYFDADTFPLGMTIAKRRPRGNVHVTVAGETFSIAQHALPLAGSEWSLLPPEVQAVAARLCRDHAPLHEALRRAPVMGVKTGDNSSFFVDVVRVRAEFAETTDGVRIPLAFLCRCVRGRDVRPWRIDGASWMLWPPRGGWDRVPRWLESLAARQGIEPDEMQLAYVRSEHLGLKVVWKDVSRGIWAAVLRDHEMVSDRRVPLVPNQTLYALEARSLEEAYLMTALLNSTIVNALAIAIAERAKDHHYRYFGRMMARIPVPHIPPRGAAWSQLARLARRAADEPPQNMAEIDHLVADLYGVSAAEHTRMAAFLHRRLGETPPDD